MVSGSQLIIMNATKIAAKQAAINTRSTAWNAEQTEARSSEANPFSNFVHGQNTAKLKSAIDQWEGQNFGGEAENCDMRLEN